MNRVQLIMEAKTPEITDLGQLEPGDGFELGDIYYARTSGPTFSQRGGTKQIKAVRLDTMDSVLLPEDTRVKRVTYSVTIREVEANS